MYKFVKLTEVPIGVTFIISDSHGTMRVLRKLDFMEHLNQYLCQDCLNESFQYGIPTGPYDVLVFEA